MSDVPSSGRKRPARLVPTCLAVLLAIAPIAQRMLPADAAAVPAGSEQWFDSRDRGAPDASAPEAGLRPAEPVSQGVLARSLLAEPAFGPPPAKSPLFRPTATAGPPVAPDATVTMAEVARDVLQRSSVGSARTPTGPPS
jgi:hypothetical protein